MKAFGYIVVIKRGGGDHDSFPLTTTSCSIGRNQECDIRVQLPTVSKQHCHIKVDSSGIAYINNVSLSNPTLLNNKVLDLEEGNVLHHKDVICIADRKFRWEYPEGSSRREKFICFTTPNKSLSKVTPSKKKRISPIKGSAKCSNIENLLLEEKGKRVSFGPYLSPEQYDKKLPPSTPVRKGQMPLELDLESSIKAKNIPIFALHNTVSNNGLLKRKKLSPVKLQTPESLEHFDNVTFSTNKNITTPSKSSSKKLNQKSHMAINVSKSEEKNPSMKKVNEKGMKRKLSISPSPARKKQKIVSDFFIKTPQSTKKPKSTKKSIKKVKTFAEALKSGMMQKKISKVKTPKRNVAIKKLKLKKSLVQKKLLTNNFINSQHIPKLFDFGIKSTGHVDSPATIIIHKKIKKTPKLYKKGRKFVNVMLKDYGKSPDLTGIEFLHLLPADTPKVSSKELASLSPKSAKTKKEKRSSLDTCNRVVGKLSSRTSLNAEILVGCESDQKSLIVMTPNKMCSKRLSIKSLSKNLNASSSVSPILESEKSPKKIKYPKISNLANTPSHSDCKLITPKKSNCYTPRGSKSSATSKKATRVVRNSLSNAVRVGRPKSLPVTQNKRCSGFSISVKSLEASCQSDKSKAILCSLRSRSRSAELILPDKFKLLTEKADHHKSASKGLRLRRSVSKKSPDKPSSALKVSKRLLSESKVLGHSTYVSKKPIRSKSLLELSSPFISTLKTPELFSNRKTISKIPVETNSTSNDLSQSPLQNVLKHKSISKTPKMLVAKSKNKLQLALQTSSSVETLRKLSSSSDRSKSKVTSKFSSSSPMMANDASEVNVRSAALSDNFDSSIDTPNRCHLVSVLQNTSIFKTPIMSNSVARTRSGSCTLLETSGGVSSDLKISSRHSSVSKTPIMPKSVSKSPGCPNFQKTPKNSEHVLKLTNFHDGLSPASILLSEKENLSMLQLSDVPMSSPQSLISPSLHKSVLQSPARFVTIARSRGRSSPSTKATCVLRSTSKSTGRSRPVSKTSLRSRSVLNTSVNSNYSLKRRTSVLSETSVLESPIGDISISLTPSKLKSELKSLKQRGTSNSLLISPSISKTPCKSNSVLITPRRLGSAIGTLSVPVSVLKAQNDATLMSDTNICETIMSKGRSTLGRTKSMTPTHLVDLSVSENVKRPRLSMISLSPSRKRSKVYVKDNFSPYTSLSSSSDCPFSISPPTPVPTTPLSGRKSRASVRMSPSCSPVTPPPNYSLLTSSSKRKQLSASMNVSTGINRTTFDFSAIRTPNITSDNFISPIGTPTPVKGIPESLSRFAQQNISECLDIPIDSDLTTYEFESQATPTISTDQFVSPLTSNHHKEAVMNSMRKRYNVKSPLKDCSITNSISKLFESKVNDLTGAYNLLESESPQVEMALQTSHEKNLTPVIGYSNVLGVKRILRTTPKASVNPVSDYTDITGLEKILISPHIRKSPKSDYADVHGVKRLLKTPSCKSSYIADYGDADGIRQLFKTPILKTYPVSDNTNVGGITKLSSKTKSKESCQPNSDYDLIGLRRLLKTPNSTLHHVPDFTEVSGIRSLLKSPRLSRQGLGMSNLEGVCELFTTPATPVNSPVNDILNSKKKSVSIGILSNLESSIGSPISAKKRESVCNIKDCPSNEQQYTNQDYIDPEVLTSTRGTPRRSSSFENTTVSIPQSFVRNINVGPKTESEIDMDRFEIPNTRCISGNESTKSPDMEIKIGTVTGNTKPLKKATRGRKVKVVSSIVSPTEDAKPPKKATRGGKKKHSPPATKTVTPRMEAASSASKETPKKVTRGRKKNLSPNVINAVSPRMENTSAIKGTPNKITRSYKNNLSSNVIKSVSPSRTEITSPAIKETPKKVTRSRKKNESPNVIKPVSPRMETTSPAIKETPKKVTRGRKKNLSPNVIKPVSPRMETTFPAVKETPKKVTRSRKKNLSPNVVKNVSERIETTSSALQENPKKVTRSRKKNVSSNDIKPVSPRMETTSLASKETPKKVTRSRKKNLSPNVIKPVSPRKEIITTKETPKKVTRGRKKNPSPNIIKTVSPSSSSSKKIATTNEGTPKKVTRVSKKNPSPIMPVSPRVKRTLRSRKV